MTPAGDAGRAGRARRDAGADANDTGVPEARGRGGLPPPAPAPLALDTALPPVDGDVHHFQPPPDRNAYLALLVTLFLEAVVPSLQCYWGVLLVMWGRPAQDAAGAGAGAGVSARLASLLDAKNTGLLWAPVLFTASWSAADPWSETLSAVHGLPVLSSLAGALLLVGGLLLAALGALLAPQSPLLPTLVGVSAGIAAGESNHRPPGPGRAGPGLSAR
ncbi:Peptide methionine sulfoxide reductase MsrA 1 [Frankliniella fusca]|uniref:Peptide methionine sulfoxide reductase MsrA 1 n=1 Tax=Frankliniella fusca TaxID=407009 RepID=A0AAE1LRX3_9NEOP|nr:Peptide methionine sulfoxide reductase MsrA 1 [Frankliniella fusca]